MLRCAWAKVKRLSAAPGRAWFTQVVMEMRLRGWCELKVASTSWRRYPMSEAQLKQISKVLKFKQTATGAEKLTDDERGIMRLACIAASQPTAHQGQASDLIEVMTWPAVG